MAKRKGTHKVIGVVGINGFETVRCLRTNVSLEAAEIFANNFKKKLTYDIQVVDINFDTQAYEKEILSKYKKEKTTPKFCMSSADFKSMQTVQHKYL